MLIAFTGKAGCGKSTASSFLFTDKGYTTEYFAKPLYEAVGAVFNVSSMHMHRREIKESKVLGFDFTFRKALQTLGTEWRDTLDRNLWVKLLDRRTFGLGLKNIAIGDLRFDHEAEWVRNNGGKVIHIVSSFGEVQAVDNPTHSSEAGVSSHLIDMVLYNSGTIDEFRQKILALVP